MDDVKIKYGEDTYVLSEPTIEQWVQLNSLKEIINPYEYSKNLLSTLTPLTSSEIEECTYKEVMNATYHLTEYLNNLPKKFKNSFIFEGKKYNFIDLPKISFGEYIDIETYLEKSEIYRQQTPHYLMAYLYREEGEEYDMDKLSDRMETFKRLPVSYLHGTLTFFLTLEQILSSNTQSYTKKVLRESIPLNRRGVGGIKHWYFLLRKTLFKLNQWLEKIAWRHSIS